MEYYPPSIYHIDQILLLLEGKDEFLVADKGTYKYIDYMYEKEDTFSDPILLECRGIKFNSDGTILSRPFHKFYNLNQKVQHTNVDWTIPHVITEKLDGSMIHSCYIDDRLELMTRAGITDHSSLARFSGLTTDIEKFCEYCESQNMTPLFEFISPKNRIVIKYKEPKLILLAVRHKVSGVYLNRKSLENLSEQFHITLVTPSIIKITNDCAKQYMNHVRGLETIEGYVIQFDTGFAFKIKTDDYVLKHKTRSHFDLEKGILQVVLEDKLDDLLPLLDEDDQKKAVNYKTSVDSNINKVVEEIIRITNLGIKVDRKEFALGLSKTIDKRFQATLFKSLDRHITANQNLDKNFNGFSLVRELVKEVFIKWCSSQTIIDNNRDLIGCEW